MAQRSTRTYRPRALEQGGNLLRERDVAKRTFGYGKWFVAWSYVHIIYALFISSVFFDLHFKGYGWAVTPLMIVSCLLQVILGNVRFKLPTRVPWTVFGLLLFFGYSIVSGLLANSDFGRNVTQVIGWHTVCLVFYAALSLSVMQANYISEKHREVIKWMIIISLVISGLVGLAQNFNIGSARTTFLGLEKQPPGIYRPTGLTNYPSQLGFQGMAGMAMLGAPLMFRNLKWWEWFGLGFFALVILSAQYRSMYYAGIGLCLVAFGFMLYRRDRPQAVIYSIVAVCIVALPLIAFPNRFVYGMKGAKDDPALQARQLAWQEAEPAMKLRPVTGIGPDASLLLGTGTSTSPDKYSTTVLDNLYISVRTCYGWVGVILAAAFVVTTFLGLLLRILLGSPVAASWGVASLLISISILFFSLTGNSIIYTTVGCLAAVIFSLTSPTWREEAEQSHMTDQFVRLRSSVANGLRKLGLNIG
jgi:MFS family permease